MISSRLLLLDKIKTLPKKKRRDFLLKCIDNSKVLDYLDLEEEEEEIEEKQIKVDDHSFCKICNKYNFIRDKYSETCQDCGYIRSITPSGKVFEKIEYIKPGSNLVKITKDSKKITVDLNKINQWLQDTDPLAKDTQKIIENLNLIFQTKGLELPNVVQNSSVSLWYNFNTMFSEYDGPLKKNYNKKAILSLCIYYGSTINGYTISLEQLSILFNINVSNIIVTNTLFKELFKETEYYKYLNLRDQQQYKCNIKLSIKNKLLFEKIKTHLKLTDNIDNKQYSAIVYFITHKINTIIKYTLKDLEEKCNVSTTSISSYSKTIEQFYKNNPKLFKELSI